MIPSEGDEGEGGRGERGPEQGRYSTEADEVVDMFDGRDFGDPNRGERRSGRR
jgi:hypothetical protein